MADSFICPNWAANHVWNFIDTLYPMFGNSNSVLHRGKNTHSWIGRIKREVILFVAFTVCIFLWNLRFFQNKVEVFFSKYGRDMTTDVHGSQKYRSDPIGFWIYPTFELSMDNSTMHSVNDA